MNEIWFILFGGLELIKRFLYDLVGNGISHPFRAFAT